jgi:hypothetical protein
MTPNLASRLEDIPGVASVVVDLEDPDRAGINVRLVPGSDEAEVMERIRALLVAYGVRSGKPPIRIGRRAITSARNSLGVDVKITPIKGGARVEVFGRSVRSFRVVPADPTAIAQGLADAWCQVLAKIPIEIAQVSLGDGGDLTVTARDGATTSVGRANVRDGWAEGVALAVGRAIGVVDAGDSPRHSNLAGAGY